MSEINIEEEGARLDIEPRFKIEMGKRFKRIWNIITSMLVGIVVLVAIALVGVRLVGFQVFTVLSGSMEPAYHVGSLIYVKSVDYKDLKEKM